MNTKKIGITLALLMIVSVAAPVATATDSATTVENQTPAIDTVSVSASYAPTAGGTTAVAVTITASDGNGYQDLSSVSVTVTKPDGTQHRAAAAATSNADGSGTTQTYAYSFDMQFYDDPAAGAAKYNVTATATDAAAATSSATTSGFNYDSLAALSLSGAGINFGTLAPGVRSSTSTLTVTNDGNVRMDLATSGSSLSDGSGRSIAASNIKYDLLASDMLNEQSLSTSAFTNSGFDLVHGASSSKATHWQIAVPSGAGQYIPGGTYTGSIELSAIQG